MTRIDFSEVAIFVSRQEKCIKCGKYTKRKQKFYQTINQFNKNKDGSVKDRDDILRDLKDAADLWRKKPLIHVKCEVL